MLKALIKFCTVGMLSLVHRHVENKPSTGLENFNLTFNGDEYKLHGGKVGIPATEEFYYEWAIAFCSAKGPKYGFDMSTFSQCVTPLAKKLKQRRIFVKDEIAQSFIILNVSPEVTNTAANEIQSLQETTHQVVEGEVDQSTEVSTQSEAVGMDSVSNQKESNEMVMTNSEVELAVPVPVSVPDVPVPPLTHKLPLEINGVTYVFEYIVSEDAVERGSVAQKLAVSFCELHGASLVDPQQLASIVQNRNTDQEQLSEQDILSSLLRKDCVEPIAGALAANMKYPRDFE